MRVSRRTAASFLVSAPLAYGCGRAAQTPQQRLSLPPAPPPEGVPADVLEAFALEFEVDENWYQPGVNSAPSDVALDRLERREAINAVWAEIQRRVESNSAPFFHWADDTASVDAHHIVSAGPALPARGGAQVPTAFSDEPFELTDAVLRRMAQANYFIFAHDPQLSEADRRIVFALRGCEIVGGAADMRAAVTLREAKPDHRTYKCVIGAWDPTGRTVSAFRGSTVPLELHLAIYQQWIGMDPRPAGNWRTCMLPQGLHRRRVGTFREDARPQNQLPLTLKQPSDYPSPVLRPFATGDALTVDSHWDAGGRNDTPASVGAHLHSGIHGSNLLQFSSQGCLTIQGRYQDGEIAQFQRAMGLTPAALNDAQVYRSGSDGREYPVMLLSGREARLHAQDVEMAHLRRVRFGSSAPARESDHVVRQLQRRVAAPDTGVFDSVSMLRLLSVQRTMSEAPGVKADGVVGPVAAAVLRDVSFD